MPIPFSIELWPAILEAVVFLLFVMPYRYTCGVLQGN